MSPAEFFRVNCTDGKRSRVNEQLNRLEQEESLEDEVMNEAKVEGISEEEATRAIKSFKNK